MKQENEITKSKQLLQTATEGTPYSMSEMFYDLYDSLPESDNTTCKDLPLKIEDEIIIIDDDDEPEIPFKKSKRNNSFSYTSHLPPSKNIKNDLEGSNNYEHTIYKESISNALNNKSSSSNNTNELNTSLYTHTINYHNSYDFYPIPSTSTNKEAIFNNEKRYQEFLTLYASDQVIKRSNSPKIFEEYCQPLIADDNTTQELNDNIKSRYDDMDPQQFNYKKESKDTDINTSNINYPIVTDVIDTIDLSVIDVDKVIAENNLILNKIRNRNINRIGKIIEVIETDPEEISPVTNDSINIEVTVSAIGAITQIEQSGLPASPARIHADPYSVQSIERQNSNNVPRKRPQKAVPKPNAGSRQIEPSVSTMLNQITNSSVLPINMPFESEIDRTTNPISQSNMLNQITNPSVLPINMPLESEIDRTTNPISQSNMLNQITNPFLLPINMPLQSEIDRTTNPISQSNMLNQITNLSVIPINMPLESENDRTTNPISQSNMLNQITNPSVIPINMPLESEIDRTTNPISQSYNSQSNNSNENIITNYNAIITCNCSQQTQQKRPDQNTQQNVNTIADNKNISTAICPICMDTLAEKVIASTLCGHLFCMPCIKNALKYHPKKCPTCRRKVSGLGYHPIYL